MITAQFTASQSEALRIFNICCDHVRGEYDRGDSGLEAIRRDALQVYKRWSHASTKKLRNALESLRPHWECGKEDDVSAILRFFGHLTEDKVFLRGVGDAFMSISSDRFIRELANVPDDDLTEDLVKSLDRACVVHPDKRWGNKRTKLCVTCYNKLMRLGLGDFPLDAALKHILRTRLRHHQVILRCREHTHRLAMPSGLCVSCDNLLESQDVDMVLKKG